MELKFDTYLEDFLMAVSDAMHNEEFRTLDRFITDADDSTVPIIRDLFLFASEENYPRKTSKSFESFIKATKGINYKLKEADSFIIDEVFSGKWKEQADLAGLSQRLAAHYAKDVLKDALKDVASNELSDSTAFTEETLNKAQEKIGEAFDSIDLTREKKVLTAAEAADIYEERVDERADGKEYKFYNDAMDALIVDGPIPKNGGTICASSGMGKTAFVLNLINGFLENNVPTMLFSLEMDLEACYDRLIAMRTMTPYKTIIKLRKDSEGYSDIRAQMDEELNFLRSRKKFRVCQEPTISIRNLEKEIKKFQKTLGEDKYCIVCVDLLSMVSEFCEPKDGLTLASTIEMAINKMNGLAKKLGIHYIGVVQLNRTVEQERVHTIDDIKKLKPTRGAIKNSNAFLERSRYCIGLFRKRGFADSYLPESEAELIEDIMEVYLMKQNNGKLGMKEMKFDGDIFKCTPISQDFS